MWTATSAGTGNGQRMWAKTLHHNDSGPKSQPGMAVPSAPARSVRTV